MLVFLLWSELWRGTLVQKKNEYDKMSHNMTHSKQVGWEKIQVEVKKRSPPPFAVRFAENLSQSFLLQNLLDSKNP